MKQLTEKNPEKESFQLASKNSTFTNVCTELITISYLLVIRTPLVGTHM